MITQMKSMLSHMIWADDRIVRTLSAAEAAPPEAVRWFAHILGADRVWLTRLNGEDSSGLPVWPEMDLAACVALAEENAAGYERLLGRLDEGAMLKDVVYRNSAGAQFSTSVTDILTHVFLHGAYHRGQINASLRGSGYEPVNVDFITFVRER
ncbi:DinB family protein [Paenibacillus alkalitolerans]|uniref:DinB family protein n=1 Tax=Paenibacillus alkalitolerans TaxID=2799335 RepID=UPI001F25A628|nr:DinB family protein [Paenibacillus alkalitolerans]